jgi:glucose/arabinose dehydrogenase
MPCHIRRLATLTVASLTIAGTLLTGCGDADGGAQAPAGTAQAPAGTSTPRPSAAGVTTIATGLQVPWGIAFLPDGTALVTERGAGWRDFNDPPVMPRVLSVSPAGQVTEVLRLSGVSARGEGGLLGIAVSPNYTTDRWVYVYYTTPDDNRIARFRLGQSQPPEPILTGIPSGLTHNGGRLAFGPDGMLYATTGDARASGNIPQDRASLGGKILRITPDGQPAPGNPFPRSPVYSMGHRNVQGLAWDAQGRLFASELGEDRFDELNLIEPGRNYGWPLVEGAADDRRFTNPIATFVPRDGSPSGMAIVGDHAYIACLRGQRLRRVGLDGRDNESLLVGQYGRLRAAAAAPDGSLWLLTSNRDNLSNAFDPRAPITADDDRILRLTL